MLMQAYSIKQHKQILRIKRYKCSKIFLSDSNLVVQSFNFEKNIYKQFKPKVDLKNYQDLTILKLSNKDKM